MASTSTFGTRRNAAQLYALAEVQREVHAKDTSSRQKYLRDFRAAFRTYESVLNSQELTNLVNMADVLLVGDYHALPSAQRFAAELLENRAQPGDRPVVLGLEAVFSQHQHILDAWWRREIDEAELRERIRFDVDWGYEWAPFYDLLITAREHADGLYGLDCMPRDDLRKIAARDRHAADKITEIRDRHPQAVLIVLFGESHFAPQHLPGLLRSKLPSDRVLTVLQNNDALYWAATNQQADQIEAVRVSSDVVCVFNATPLEKYESYRLYLSSCSEDCGQPDLVPTIYNLIDSLVSFLEINRYASHNGTQPKFLVDSLPEVLCGPKERVRELLLRTSANTERIENIFQRMESRGSAYLPTINAVYINEFRLMCAAEEVARFLHHACRGLPMRKAAKAISATARTDRFYARVVEHALAYFGSRVLYPARPDSDDCSYLTARLLSKIEQDATRGGRLRFDEQSEKLGYAIGTQLYHAYIRGSLNRSSVRHLFLAHVEQPGEGLKICKEILRKVRTSKKKPCLSTH